MARLVRHDRTRPYVFQVGGETVAICACGLSKNKPHCDGTHKIARDESPGGLYVYDEQGNRTEVTLTDKQGNPVQAPSEYPEE